MESLVIPLTLTGLPPDQPFPPRNLRVQEGAARTTAESTWAPPVGGPRPDGYEYKIDGSTTQAAAATVATNAIHVNLNPGVHTLSVRSTKAGASPSTWATRDFVVRGEGCNPVESLEEGEGGTRDAPIWNARNLFWAAPIGGMAVTGHLWELFDSDGNRIRNGTTGATERRVNLFNLEEGTYTFTVRAVCADGPSDAKSIGFTAICPPPEPPERPEVIVSGLSDEQSANATWAAPTTGGAPTGYIWEVVGPENREGTVAQSVLSVLLSGLPDGGYQFRIRSTGDCNKESTRQIVHFEIGGTTTCQSPRVLRKQEGAIWSTWTVLWLAPSYGDTPLRYDWRMDGPTQPSGQINPNQADNLSGQVTVDNLTPGLYRFFVKTICDLNPVPPATGDSKESSITIRVERKAPENPRNVSVESVTASIVDETNPCPPTPSWVGTWDPPEGGSAPSNYDWELYDSTNARTLNSTVPALTRRAVLGRLAPGAYRFQVRSKSGTQTSGWESYGFTVPVEDLNPPVIRSATATEFAGAETWTFRWDKDPCGLEPDGYTYRLRESGQSSDFRGPTRVGTTLANRTVQLSGGTNGSHYTFYVKAHRGTRETAETRIAIQWGRTTNVNPPENLRGRNRNQNGSNVRFTWDPPSEGLAPARYWYQLSGPQNESGWTNPNVRRVDFEALPAGSYTFRARSDVATQRPADGTGTGANFSNWATTTHLVVGGNCAPGEIELVETGSALRGPDWKGGEDVSRRIEWDPSQDGAVTGYDWSGTWTHAARTGSTGTADSARRVNLGAIPLGTYTITVHGKKGTERCGSRSKQFDIVRRNLEPPSALEVETTGDADAGWVHDLTFDPPETGRLVTGFEYRRYEDDETPPTVWQRTTDTEIEIALIEDGNWNVDVRSYDAHGSSDHVTVSFDQPPSNLKMDPPEGVMLTVGKGANWNGATANWRPPSGENPLEPDSYRWRLRGAEERDSEEGVQGLTHTFTSLAIGDYQFDILCVKEGYEDSDWVGASFSIAEPPPSAVVGLKCADGSSRTKKIVTWRVAPDSPTDATGFEYSVTGATSIPETPLSIGTTRIELDLDSGKSTVTVRATKGELKSEAASTECTVAATTCPAPINLVAKQSPNNDKIWSLDWDAPEITDAHKPITQYEYELSGAKSETRKLPSLTTVHTFTDLTVGEYSFKVRSICGDEESDWTQTVSFEVPDDPLYKPENLTVTQDEDAPAPKDVTATWTANDEGRTPTGYKIRLTGTKTIAETPVTGTTHTFSDLAEGSYTVYVRATIADDESTEEAQASFDVATPEVLPAAVTGLTHSLADDGRSVTYSWGFPTSGPGSDIDGFEAEQRASSGGTRMEDLDKSVMTWQQSDLTLNSQYTMTIHAYKDNGERKEGPAATVTFRAEAKPQPPNTPVDFKHQVQVVQTGIVGVVGPTTGRSIDVTLSWKADAEGAEADDYTLTLTDKENQTLTALMHKYTNVSPGDKEATVTANNDAGSSEPATLTFTLEDCEAPEAVSNLDLNTAPASGIADTIIAKGRAYMASLSRAQKIGMVAALGAAAVVTALGAPIVGALAATGYVTIKMLAGIVSINIGFAGGAGLVTSLVTATGLSSIIKTPLSMRASWRNPEGARPETEYNWSLSGSDGIITSGTVTGESVEITTAYENWLNADSLSVTPTNECGAGEVRMLGISIGDEGLNLGGEEEEEPCKPPPAPQNGNASRGGGSPVVHLSWSPGFGDEERYDKTVGYVVEGSGSPYGDGTTTSTFMQFHGDEIDSAGGGGWTVWAISEGGCYSTGLSISLESTAGFDRVRTFGTELAPPRELVERVTTVIIYDPVP